ncbi:MAG: DUF6291 domain-containing protein [Eubacteriales bacterium]
MADRNKDFLLFSEWYDALMNMSPNNCKLVLQSMVEYQTKGIEPPEFPKRIKDVCYLMFCDLRRRMERQKNGKLGAEAVARLKRERDDRQ